MLTLTSTNTIAKELALLASTNHSASSTRSAREEGVLWQQIATRKPSASTVLRHITIWKCGASTCYGIPHDRMVVLVVLAWVLTKVWRILIVMCMK